jgi:DNA-binding MarR family transcriptional regulator
MIDLDRQAALHDAIEALYFAYRGFTDQADRILDKRGLGRVHHRILYFIGRRPDVSVQGLLDLLAVSKQALNAPLRQLVGMGLVSALPAPRDRRVKNLRLTPEGRKLETALTETQMRQLQAALDRAGPAHELGWRTVMAELARD